jgi:LysR family transcriptional regulator, transcription activator of glutamate synthase operon
VERASGVLLKLLENREIHVACLLVPPEGADLPPGISTRPLFSRELVVVVSPQHPLARQTHVTLDEIAAERLILTSPEEAPRRIIDRGFRAHGYEPLVSFEADDPATLIGLAAEGVGIGITGENIARRNSDKVVSLTIDGPPLRYAMALAWSDRGPHTKAMATFLDFAAVYLTDWGARTLAETVASAEAIS